MKKLTSVIIITVMLIGLIPIIPAGAVGTLLYQTSFEGSWHNSSWYDYYPEQFADGVLGHSTNKTSDYITTGSQSLHYYDKTDSTYFGMLTPTVEIKDFGKYTLTADALAVSGKLKLIIRCYYPDMINYVQEQVLVEKGSGSMSSYSVSINITPEAPYMRVLLFTGTDAKNEEGYVDNIKVIKTGTYDGADLHNKESVNKQLASLSAGSVVEIPDGTYYDWNINISANGTKANPITIKAKNPGKAVIKGESSIVVTGDYVNIEGLRFEEITTYENVVDFRAASYGSKIYDCAFYNCHPKDGDDTSRQFWVVLNGTKLTVENCFFSHKHSVGQMVSFSKSASNVGIPDEHLIKNCYFGNITNQTGNGYEAIRMGSSTYCFENSRTVVEGCFFEKCDGEGETISVKTCENIIRNNTLYNSNGAIVLRHGDRNDIYGNLFVGGVNKKRPTGVRIIGEDHKVHDNYFYNLPTSSQVLLFFNGNPYENIENHWYYPVKNAQVYNNTFIGGDRLVTVGGYAPSDTPSSNRTMAPQGHFNNNALVSFTGAYNMFTNGDPSADLNITDSTAYHKVTFSGNLAYGRKVGYTPEGINVGYFELTEDGNYYKAPNGKGANLEEVKKAPTSPFDVISDWVKEVYYDSGLITFEPVPNDVFNIEDAHISNIVPFDVTYFAGSGGSLTLRENGTVVSGKTTFSGNPELVFKAAPDSYKKISRWYVNGIEVDEQNAKVLGVKIATPTSATLSVRSLYKNYNIEVEFEEDALIPDGISSPVASFESSENASFINQNGTKTSISGCYKLLATRLETFPYADIIEYGFLVSTVSGGYKKVKSEIPLTASGAYGVLFYGFNKGETYFFYPYAVYQLHGGESETITGEQYVFICE